MDQENSDTFDIQYLARHANSMFLLSKIYIGLQFLYGWLVTFPPFFKIKESVCGFL